MVIASDVTITNAGGVLDQSLAEYVLGLVLALAKDLHGTLDRQRNIAGSIDRSGGWPAAAHASSDSAASIEPRPGSWPASGLHVDAVARTARAWDGDVGVIHAVEELRRWSASTA